MSKPALKRPVTPNFLRTETSTGLPVVATPVKNYEHWSHTIYECVVCTGPDGILNLTIEGGSDNGEFPFFGPLRQDRITYIDGFVEEGDIIIEVQGQKVAGYTQRDVVAWINHCCRNGNPVSIKAVRSGYLTKDLRQYLNTCFQKGSVDHDLQNIIRDSLYLRTIPCTTRPPRPGEVNGVDYTFLTPEEFIALDKSGNLLESGIYEGNHYGTPKPPRESPMSTPHRTNSMGNVGSVLPGAHPSYEGKRRRNRSNVEAMASKNIEATESSDYPLLSSQHSARSSTPQSLGNLGDVGQSDSFSDLGPLPVNWEKAYTETGETYFINYNHGTSQWLDPRLQRIQKKTNDEELPYGWEKIDDPHYGTYYIDHVNRRTQYENPVSQDKHEGLEVSLRRDHNAFPHSRPLTLQEHPGMESSNTSGPSVTNRESLLVSSTGQTVPVSTTITTPHPVDSVTSGLQVSSSSPESSSRFPYLPCIPCLSDKHDPNISSGKACNTESTSQEGPNVNIMSDSHNVPKQAETSVLTQNTLDEVQTLPQIAWSPSIGRAVENLYVPSKGPRSPGSHRENPYSISRQTLGSAVGYRLPYVFTSNVSELQGEILRTSLLKSTRGFGFTIVGGDNPEEFLQIKSVVPNSPAWKDGRLETGDILVYMNDRCVLGFTHQDMVELFQSIPPGNIVHLEVCRGYPLLFDPNDPNTEIVTTVAVSSSNTQLADGHSIYSPGQGGSKIDNSQFLGDIGEAESMGRSAKSMPDLSTGRIDHQHPQRHNSTDLLSPNGLDSTPDILDFNPQSSHKPEFLTVDIVKGSGGFGFTIADSSYGQKMKLQDDYGSTCKSANSTASVHGSGHLPPIPGAYRSKTPTADLYSSRDKESISISRPKTPLVDTRNWIRAPTSEFPQESSKSPSGGTGNMSNLTVCGESRSTSFGRDGTYSGLLKVVDQSGSSRANAEKSWYGDRGRESLWNYHSFRELGMNASENYKRRELLYGYIPYHHRDRDIGPVLRDPVNSYSPCAQSDQAGNESYHSRVNMGYVCGYGDMGDSFRDLSSVYNHSRKSSGYSPYSTGYSYNTVLYPSSELTLHDPGNEVASTYFTPPSSYYVPPSTSRVGPQYDSLTQQQKHTTSFEHEQPAAVSLNHIPRDSRSTNSSLSPNPYGMTVSRPPPLDQIPDSIEMTVTLVRQENGFGFRIVGGTEEGSQVSIGHIVPGGAADLDGRMRSGDEIIFVNNQVVINTSHHHVVQLMGNAAVNGRVTLGIRRRISPLGSLSHRKACDNIYPYEVIVTRMENEGFGFVIISSVGRSGSTIGRIIEGSPAERCGQLHVGDRILAVNGISILNAHHGEIVNLIKDSGYSVTLMIGPPQDDTSSIASTPHRGEDNSTDQDVQYYSVELHRGTRGFGFSIRGGKEFQNMPLFVLRIAENGPAHQDNRLQVGDQIIEINGINTKNMSHAEAIELIRKGSYSVRLLVKRGGKFPSGLNDHPSPSSLPVPPMSALYNGPISQSSPRGPPHPDSISRKYDAHS
ncbi:membrane-associated guanylate kinase, WW and PDZ domain-containing protein 1-like isoform X2 [Tachypleus tridentatus]|uniref:membrane-associated guanylate kinase, WW and PDZ domain-containing protein 1-like isoform X2 n=1 Tax=Tachypleus tridentatus TaxID=6853 RepID=UPI003FD3F58E